MAVEITGTYTGNLKMELTHGPSGAQLKTAAPVDNKGDGSSFSPTDLLAASLGSCMVTTMAIVARRNDAQLTELRYLAARFRAGVLRPSEHKSLAMAEDLMRGRETLRPKLPDNLTLYEAVNDDDTVVEPGYIPSRRSLRTRLEHWIVGYQH